MTRLTIVVLALGLLLCSACASGSGPAANAPAPAATPTARAALTPTPAPEIIAVTAGEVRLAAGAAGEAALRLDIAEGWHVNANPPSDKFYIGTEVQAEPQGGVAPGKPVYPRGLTKKFQFSAQPLAVYEGRAVVRLPLRADASAAKGRKTFRARVRYQPCNDRECLQPRTIEAEIPLTVS
ncbi:MAG TPA: protein-disulfide reductase DsbD domain-containing protein [Pyrinomonadaceae bacterium]|nr:protein-disulfide reductase DsbD domain-containing protein [Pyrinomonadaceae bacterium]